MPANELEFASILYVEDDPMVKEAMEDFFKLRIKNLYIASDGEEGLEIYKQNKDTINIVITDIQMPKMNGIEMLTKIKEINPNIRAIITTAYNDKEYLMESIKMGVDTFMSKPIDLRKLVKTIIEQMSIIRYVNNKTLYENALNLALDVQDGLAFVTDGQDILAINQEFKNYFGVLDTSDIPKEISDKLFSAIESKADTIEFDSKKFSFNVGIDEDKMLKIVSMEL